MHIYIYHLHSIAINPFYSNKCLTKFISGDLIIHYFWWKCLFLYIIFALIFFKNRNCLWMTGQLYLNRTYPLLRRSIWKTIFWKLNISWYVFINTYFLCHLLFGLCPWKYKDHKPTIIYLFIYPLAPHLSFFTKILENDQSIKLKWKWIFFCIHHLHAFTDWSTQLFKPWI